MSAPPPLNLPDGQVAPGRHRIGVIVNPNSSRNRARLADLDAVIGMAGDLPVRRAGEPDAIGAGVAELLDAGCTVIAVAGGDGTVQLVLDAVLNGARHGQLAVLAILPGGTTNMIANDVGATARPAEELRRLLRANAAGVLGQKAERRTLIALRTAPTARPAYGLFFGAAGIVQGTMLIRRSVNRVGMRDSAGPLTGLLSLVGPMLLGRNPIRPVPARVWLDGATLPEARYLAIVASTMTKLSLGLDPFWDKGPGAIKVTLVREHPRKLASVVWPALRGRAHAELTPENGYVSRNVERLELAIDERGVMDGEFFAAEPGQRLVLEAGPMMTFVRG